ncbi:unnamed protein product, partial [Brassica rapa subsp. trilocularis]
EVRREGLRTRHRPHRNHREAALKIDRKSKDPSERASCHHHTRRRDHPVATTSSPETARPSPGEPTRAYRRSPIEEERPSFRSAPSEASPEPNHGANHHATGQKSSPSIANHLCNHHTNTTLTHARESYTLQENLTLVKLVFSCSDKTQSEQRHNLATNRDFGGAIHRPQALAPPRSDHEPEKLPDLNRIGPSPHKRSRRDNRGGARRRGPNNRKNKKTKTKPGGHQRDTAATAGSGRKRC